MTQHRPRYISISTIIRCRLAVTCIFQFQFVSVQFCNYGVMCLRYRYDSMLSRRVSVRPNSVVSTTMGIKRRWLFG